MSRGMGKVQRAILDDMIQSDRPQEVAWMARWLYGRIYETESPESLPRAYMVSVRRAVCALEQSRHVCAGLAPRYFAPKNDSTAKMDLTKWLWLPDMQPPEGWCCPFPRKVSAQGEARDNKATLTVSVASQAPPPMDEVSALFADMVDGIYRVEPMASELRALTSPSEITDKICDFFDIPHGSPQSYCVMVQVLRHVGSVDNVVDNTMDTMDNVS